MVSRRPCGVDDDEHWDLSLKAADARVALALHPGTTDFPRQVLEFTPDGLAHQLNDAATKFLEAPGALTVDEAKRVVTLPAACELLRADLVLDAAAPPAGPTDDRPARHVLKTCLKFVGKRRWRQLSALLLPDDADRPVVVRFRPPSAKCHDALCLVRSDNLRDL